MIRGIGIHPAFFVLGGLTLLSSLLFSTLRSGDGQSISQTSSRHGGPSQPASARLIRA